MDCTFLTGRYLLCCAALRHVYVPSISELDEYCRNDRYAICPFYGKREDGPKNMPRAEVAEKEKRAA